MNTHLFTIVPNADMWSEHDFAFVIMDSFDGTAEYVHTYAYIDTFEAAVKAVCEVSEHLLAAGDVGFPLDDLHTNLAMSAWYREDQEATIAETLKEMQDEYDANPAFDFYKNRRRSTDEAPHATPNALFSEGEAVQPYAIEVTVPLSYTEPLQNALSSSLNSLREDLKLARQNRVRPPTDKDGPLVAEYQTKRIRIRQERIDALTRQIEAVEGVMRQVGKHV